MTRRITTGFLTLLSLQLSFVALVFGDENPPKPWNPPNELKDLLSDDLMNWLQWPYGVGYGPCLVAGSSGLLVVDPGVSDRISFAGRVVWTGAGPREEEWRRRQDNKSLRVVGSVEELEKAWGWGQYEGEHWIVASEEDVPEAVKSSIESRLRTGVYLNWAPVEWVRRVGMILWDEEKHLADREARLLMTCIAIASWGCDGGELAIVGVNAWDEPLPAWSAARYWEVTRDDPQGKGDNPWAGSREGEEMRSWASLEAESRVLRRLRDAHGVDWHTHSGPLLFPALLGDEVS